MSVYEWCEWLESSAMGVQIAESTWLFPTIETIHVLALVLVFGSIAMVDVRLLGLASRQRSISDLSAQVLPWTWISFAVAAVSGGLLFTSSATRYYDNNPFRVKLILLALAGLNMLFFNLVTSRTMQQWDRTAAVPFAVKAAGALSLTFWTMIVIAGRWIGFT